MLGSATKSFIFVSLMKPQNVSGHVWSSSEEPEGQQVISALQSFYTMRCDKSTTRQKQVTSNLFTLDFRSFINTVAFSMLPELAVFTRMAEQYEQMGAKTTTLHNGIFDVEYPRPDQWGSYIPRSLLSGDELAIWITNPMPEAFVSISTHASHPDSLESLILMVCSRPFVDKRTGWLLSGPGGVSFAVYLLVRILITARYLVNYPAGFRFLVDPATSISRIRSTVRACTAFLISDMQVFLERAPSNTSRPESNAVMYSFMPYPKVTLPPYFCSSSANIFPPDISNENGKKKSKATKDASGSSRRGKKKDTGSEKSKDKKKVEDSIAKIDGMYVPVDTSWELFLEKYFERIGKPLPEHLKAAIENRKAKHLARMGKPLPEQHLRIAIKDSNRQGNRIGNSPASVEDITVNASGLQIALSSLDSLPTPRKMQGGKRHVSGGSDIMPERKRTKELACDETTVIGQSNDTTCPKPVEYIIISDSELD
ncbi:hypothetical protein RHS03_08485, partial [Rhizoctonia solani]